MLKEGEVNIVLNFIGCGSAFNTELGNNGAFIKKGDTLFLIDCGSSTFSKIQQVGLLEDVNEINVILTHTHADHIGSLGDLILYGYYSMGEVGVPSVTVFTPSDLDISAILEKMGVERETYELMEFSYGAGFHDEGFEIDFEAVPVKHVKNLKCFGYVIRYENQTAYYSGDCYEIPEEILERFIKNEFNFFYQDTCKADYKGNVHLSLRELTELVEPHLRDKVHCMHLDSSFSIQEAEDLGFNVVRPYMKGQWL